MTQNIEILAKKGKANTNGIELYFESFGNDTDPAIVLIMGLDAQCVLWSPAFIEPLVAAGFRVIRFDNRDIGLSTWIENWQKSSPYTLEDMAQDTIGLLDYLGIEQAHFMGASMGGMITQRIAISYPERVLSIICHMSSAHPLDLEVVKGLPKKMFVKMAPLIMKYLPIKTRWTHHKGTVGSYLATYKFLSGTKHKFDREYFRELFTYSILERQGQNPRARLQQFSAVVASGSRLQELHKIEAPALILHGNADKLVPIGHSKKYAKLIKNARFVELDGIGHEIPRAEYENIIPLLLEHLKKGV
jgi:pimeloyl-ACP methyl ester carboxylesterase